MDLSGDWCILQAGLSHLEKYLVASSSQDLIAGLFPLLAVWSLALPPDMEALLYGTHSLFHCYLHSCCSRKSQTSMVHSKPLLAPWTRQHLSLPSVHACTYLSQAVGTWRLSEPLFALDRLGEPAHLGTDVYRRLSQAWKRLA